MPATWYQAQVLDIEDVNSGVRRFFLKTDSAFPAFQAGQFITFDLPVGEKRQHRWKSYSIANAPNDDGLLELCIVRHPQGMGTAYLFDKISKGSTLTFKGPEGNFILPQNLESTQLIMVCTGTGIAPFRSMIQEVTLKQIPFLRMHLIFGARKVEDILYREEMEKLAEILPNFSYDICLSKEPSWPGYKGHVHQVYLEKYKAIDKQNLFYLCGWTKMIDEAVINLVANLGYDKSRVRYELYG